MNTTYRFALLSVCLALTGAAPPRRAAPADPFLPMDKSLVRLNSKEGREGRTLLNTSQYQEQFWNLIEYYAPQDNNGSCGVASATMVLNALPLGDQRSVSPDHAPYRLFTPKNFFTKKVSAIFTTEEEAAAAKRTMEEQARWKVSRRGMTLEQITRALNTFPVKAEHVHASDTTLPSFRERLRKEFPDPNRYVLVNYHRPTLGQLGSGHFSPLGAYNTEADRVLILDTANFRYPWVWVETERLWKAMNTRDADPAAKGRTRGFVVVFLDPPEAKAAEK
jgi:hypothetical protein